MITLTVDGRTVSVPPGTLLVEAARQAGIEIPVYCYHPKLAPAGACRMCLVEVEKMPKLQTACTTAVAEGMVVRTGSPQVREARRGVLELLLINHPLDCPICDKGGECDLQDFTLRHGPPASRFLDGKITRRKALDCPPFLVIDEERCILCQRCVRYEDEVLGERNLVLVDRGSHMTIGTQGRSDYPGYFSGNNTELCPVGALTSRPYRFKARPWDLRHADTVCTQCSLHCNVRADTRHGDLMRLMSRDNPEVDGGWLCDRGRYAIGDARAPERLRQPLLRGEPVSWEVALAEVQKALAAGPVAGLGGGRLTNEAARAFKEICGTVDWRVGRQTCAQVPGVAEAKPSDLDAADVIVLVDTCVAEQAPVLDLRIRRNKRVIDVGPVPNMRVGRAERVVCPPGGVAAALATLDLSGARHPVVVWNGRGDLVDAIAGLGAPVLMVHEVANARGAHDAGLEVDGDILAAAAEGKIHTLWLAGANVPVPDVPVLIVSEMYPTEVTKRATIVLPVAGPFERAGTFTNLGGLTQRAAAVIQPLAPSDLQIFQRLKPAPHPVRDLPPRKPWPVGNLVARPLLYGGRGNTRFDPTLAAARPTTPVVVVHPSHGLTPGTRVVVNDRLEAIVAVDARIYPGVVVIPDHDAAGLGANAVLRAVIPA
jgi:NADH dehydrogenase/NADH:ubiquinone oxidoreductase subunit G